LSVLVKNTIGIRRVISISKIKKIKLIIKKWILKGVWLLDIGSKPHSNGDDFSRSLNIFLEIKKLINIIKIEIDINMIKISDNCIIIYTKIKLDFLIGS